MTGYQVQRDALKGHIQRVEELKRSFDASVSRFSANPGLVLTNDDFTWAGESITRAYISQMGKFFMELQHVSDALTDTIAALQCAHKNYGAAESVIEGSLQTMENQVKQLSAPRSARDIAFYQNPLKQALL